MHYYLIITNTGKAEGTEDNWILTSRQIFTERAANDRINAMAAIWRDNSVAVEVSASQLIVLKHNIEAMGL